MNTKVRQLLESLPDSASVVDVGGGACPVARADYVLDVLPYDQRNRGSGVGTGSERFTAETWRQLDLCDRTPWPFPDHAFDFAVCSHVLEDLRDPVWACCEMARIAKAGYVETPSRIVEQSKGVEHPLYAGYYHHRWLVTEEDGGLCFRHKPHSLHSLGAALVADVGAFGRINPRYEALAFEWRGSLRADEVINSDEADVNRELIAFAAEARKLSDLVIPRDEPLAAKLKRFVYYLRLRMPARKA